MLRQDGTTMDVYVRLQPCGNYQAGLARSERECQSHCQEHGHSREYSHNRNPYRPRMYSVAYLRTDSLVGSANSEVNARNSTINGNQSMEGKMGQGNSPIVVQLTEIGQKNREMTWFNQR